jgi:hypothetical protein
VREDVSAASTPFASRLRHGFVVAESLQDEWEKSPRQEFIDRLNVGRSGKRIPPGIAAQAGERGYLFTGPDALLPPGEYVVEFAIRPRSFRTLLSFIKPIVIEVVVGSECIEQRSVKSLLWATEAMRFRVSEACYLRRGLTEFRLLRGRAVDFVVTSVKVTQLAAGPGDVPVHGGERALFDLLNSREPAAASSPARSRRGPSSRITASGTA